jgi:hypothetical protein
VAEGGGSSEVLALNCQLQDAERMRAEREQELIEAKKRIVDLEGGAYRVCMRAWHGSIVNMVPWRAAGADKSCVVVVCRMMLVHGQMPRS